MAAANVFGEPVTDETVRKHFPKKEVITRKDRAYVAYCLINEGTKKRDAERYVLSLKEKYGDGIATLCTIYNATGDTLTYFKDHDFSGHVRDGPYPKQIENGQWAAFLHVVGSSGAVLYSGRNYDESGGQNCVWLHSWWNVPNDNRKFVYTEVRKPDHYPDTFDWSYVYKLICDGYGKDTSLGCYSAASITQNNPYMYSGVMSLGWIP